MKKDELNSTLDSIIESLYNNDVNDSSTQKRVVLEVAIVQALIESYNRDLKKLRATYSTSINYMLDKIQEEIS